MATSFIRVFAMSAFDDILLQVGTGFDAYIDDTGLSRTGYPEDVVAGLVSSARGLHQAITEVLGCSLAMDKIGL
eukprot:2008862-Pyramimonas_sp.AAC.1